MDHKRFLLAKKTHLHAEGVSLRNPIYQKAVLHHTQEQISEDTNGKNDRTTALFPQQSKKIRAIIKSKSKGIIAGLEELSLFFDKVSEVRVKFFKKDGEEVKKNEPILELHGTAMQILTLERTVLNLLQRMSGIATLTNSLKKKIPAHVLLTPTRKTLWGLLDKKACVVGGGGTHRLNLDDAILIKDTHIDLLDHNWKGILEQLLNTEDPGRFIEIEVEKESEAFEIASQYAHTSTQSRLALKVPWVIMFDNMSPLQIKKTLSILQKRKLSTNLLFEASGGINTKNMAAYGKSGVDIISMGALTHSASALDFSLKILS